MAILRARRRYQISLLVCRQRRRHGMLVWSTSNPSTSSRLETVDFAFEICRVRLGDCIKVSVCAWIWLFSFVFSSIMIESIISHIRACWNFSYEILFASLDNIFRERDNQNHVQILSKRRSGFPGNQLPHTRSIKQLQILCDCRVMYFLWLYCVSLFIRGVVPFRVTSYQDGKERPSTSNAGHSRRRSSS